jgi:hypothetical protein
MEHHSPTSKSSCNALILVWLRYAIKIIILHGLPIVGASAKASHRCCGETLTTVKREHQCVARTAQSCCTVALVPSACIVKQHIQPSSRIASLRSANARTIARIISTATSLADCGFRPLLSSTHCCHNEVHCSLLLLRTSLQHLGQRLQLQSLTKH